MIVKDIKLENFRNYDVSFTDFDNTVNVIIGDNGQGKTNLLEAIYYLTCGKSFRTRFDKEIINFDKNSALIEATVLSEGRQQKLEAKMTRGSRKQLFLNGVKLKTAAELSGKLTAVLFCPDDLYIIKDGASARRRLLDGCISQLRPRYVSVLTEFNKIYEQKVRILKDYHEKPSLLEPLDDYNIHLAAMSAELIRYRAYFARKLSENAKVIHKEFSGDKEELTVEYKTVKTVTDPFQSVEVLTEQILAHQASHRNAEIESGLCLTGAHKDDLEISINGISARSFASQGQMRTAALSLKLAEREIHFDEKGEYPVLLLDDVLSELDPGRQNFVLNRIAEGQIFITCCEDGQIAEKTGGRVIRIRKGAIS